MLPLLLLASFAAAPAEKEPQYSACPLLDSPPPRTAFCDPQRPVYPTEAIARRLEGHVFLEVVISEAGGSPVEVLVVSQAPEQIFEAAAVRSVQHSCWPQYRQGGSPKCYRLHLPLTFKLAD